MVSQRVSRVQESLTLKLSAKAAALKAEGRDVIAYTAGELDFAPPEAVQEAVREAMAKGQTRYTPVGGTPDLKQAISDRFHETLGIRYEAAEIAASCGAKHSLYNLVAALCDPGDEVVIPTPFWLSYPAMVELCDAKPVLAEGNAAFKLEPDVLEAALTDRSRILFITTPSNPTGAVYTGDELSALADVVRRYPKLHVVSDEIYDRLTYDGVKSVSILQVAPDLRGRTIIVNGVSKTYAMTGFRIGWAAGPREVIAAAMRLQSHSTSGPNSLAQFAAAAALRRGNDALERWLPELVARRDAMVSALEGFPGFEIVPPKGAFYCFPKVKGLLGRTIAGRDIQTPFDLCALLLEEADAAFVPGEPFGAPEHIRLSFAMSRSDLERGLDRVGAFLREHAS